MKIEITEKNGVKLAHVTDDAVVLKDMWSALDLVIAVRGRAKVKNFTVPKEIIAPELFDKATGFAEKIQSKLNKFGMRCAIYGDFSMHDSAFQNFMNDLNNGDTLFFTPDKETAAERLSISLL